MRELFGRENYEYYARLTGRILKVEDEWIFFTYPLDYLGVRTDIDIDCRPGFRSSQHEVDPTGSLEMIPENCPLDPSGRLSISLDTEHCMSSLESRREAGAGEVCIATSHSVRFGERQQRPNPDFRYYASLGELVSHALMLLRFLSTTLVILQSQTVQNVAFEQTLQDCQ